MVEDNIYVSLTQLRQTLDRCFETIIPFAQVVSPRARPEIIDYIIHVALGVKSGQMYEPPSLQNLKISVDTDSEICDNVVTVKEEEKKDG
nr:MAG TPA: hypothetical protein [Caudoviricetes sp.]